MRIYNFALKLPCSRNCDYKTLQIRHVAINTNSFFQDLTKSRINYDKQRRFKVVKLKLLP